MIAVCALISSFLGAACLSLIPQSFLRPFVFVMLIVIAVYTLLKKNFGQVHSEISITPKLLVLAAIGSLLIGFMTVFLAQERAVSSSSFYSFSKC